MLISTVKRLSTAPTGKLLIVKHIKRLDKIDSFFNIHAEVLAGSISTILRMIERTQTFPSKCKRTTLVLLEKRSIFFLDFLAKLIESVTGESLDEILPPECEGQFAYQKKAEYGSLCRYRFTPS